MTDSTSPTPVESPFSEADGGRGFAHADLVQLDPMVVLQVQTLAVFERLWETVESADMHQWQRQTRKEPVAQLVEAAGALRMCQRFAAARLADELARFVDWLQRSRMGAELDAAVVVVEAMAALAVELEGLTQKAPSLGYPEALGVLNRLRGARGLRPLSHTELLAADIVSAVTSSTPGGTPGVVCAADVSLARIQAFQLSLSRWLRAPGADVLSALAADLEALIEPLRHCSAGRLTGALSSLLWRMHGRDDIPVAPLRCLLSRLERVVAASAPPGARAEPLLIDSVVLAAQLAGCSAQELEAFAAAMFGDRGTTVAAPTLRGPASLGSPALLALVSEAKSRVEECAAILERREQGDMLKPDDTRAYSTGMRRVATAVAWLGELRVANRLLNLADAVSACGPEELSTAAQALAQARAMLGERLRGAAGALAAPSVESGVPVAVAGSRRGCLQVPGRSRLKQALLAELRAQLARACAAADRVHVSGAAPPSALEGQLRQLEAALHMGGRADLAMLIERALELVRQGRSMAVAAGLLELDRYLEFLMDHGLDEPTLLRRLIAVDEPDPPTPGVNESTGNAKRDSIVGSKPVRRGSIAAEPDSSPIRQPPSLKNGASMPLTPEAWLALGTIENRISQWKHGTAAYAGHVSDVLDALAELREIAYHAGAAEIAALIEAMCGLVDRLVPTGPLHGSDVVDLLESLVWVLAGRRDVVQARGGPPATVGYLLARVRRQSQGDAAVLGSVAAIASLRK